LLAASAGIPSTPAAERGRYRKLRQARGTIQKSGPTTENCKGYVALVDFATSKAASSRRTPKLWTDGDFDFTAAGLHAFEGLWEIVEGDLFGDEILRGDIASLDGF